MTQRDTTAADVARHVLLHRPALRRRLYDAAKTVAELGPNIGYFLMGLGGAMVWTYRMELLLAAGPIGALALAAGGGYFVGCFVTNLYLYGRLAAILESDRVIRYMRAATGLKSRDIESGNDSVVSDEDGVE